MTKRSPARLALAAISSTVPTPSERVLWTWNAPATVRACSSRSTSPPVFAGDGGSVIAIQKKTAATRAAVVSTSLRMGSLAQALAGYTLRVGAKRVSLVGALPSELRLGAAEVAERRGLAVDRPAQVEGLDDALRRQLEVRADDLAQLVVGQLARAGGVDQDRHRLGDANRVRELHHALARPARPRRRSSRRSAPCSRPSGRPSSDPCPRTRRRRAAPRRRRCRR